MTMKMTMCEFVHGLTDEQACNRITNLQRENEELRGYVEDLIGILDEIYKPVNVEIVREIIDFCEYELGIEVDK